MPNRSERFRFESFGNGPFCTLARRLSIQMRFKGKKTPTNRIVADGRFVFARRPSTQMRRHKLVLHVFYLSQIYSWQPETRVVRFFTFTNLFVAASHSGTVQAHPHASATFRAYWSSFKLIMVYHQFLIIIDHYSVRSASKRF